MPLRGLELVSVSVSPTLTCGVIKMSPLRGLACWYYCHVDACGGKADGWGVRACVVALTVGLIFCQLFHQGKSWKKKVGLIFWFLFHLWERNLKKNLYFKKFLCIIADCRCIIGVIYKQGIRSGAPLPFKSLEHLEGMGFYNIRDDDTFIYFQPPSDAAKIAIFRGISPICSENDTIE